jgi:hypothetical protein
VACFYVSSAKTSSSFELNRNDEPPLGLYHGAGELCYQQHTLLDTSSTKARNALAFKLGDDFRNNYIKKLNSIRQM